jgi:hypothetical protein
MVTTKGPPLWAVDAAKQLSRGLKHVQWRMAPPAATLLELVASMWRPHAIGVVAELGIADLLATGPRDAASLARATGSDEEALLRVLRALAHDGILGQDDQGRFGLTALSEPLRSDHPQSLRQTVRQTLSQWNHRSWGDLLASVRTGEPAFARLHGGKDLWQWFADEAPEQGTVFHASMEELTRLSLPLVLAAHDFGQYRRILDLGGGRGTLIAGILAAHRSLQGGILDLREPLAGAPELLDRAGVRMRCELIEGSAFDPLPRGWDVYMMKHILHGATPAQLGQLLGNVRDALPTGGRYIALEMLIPENRTGVYPAFLDLQMLVNSGGRERSASEYRALFTRHGLRVIEVVRTAAPVALIVAERG